MANIEIDQNDLDGDAMDVDNASHTPSFPALTPQQAQVHFFSSYFVIILHIYFYYFTFISTFFHSLT